MFSNLGWGCMFELSCYRLFSNNTHHINQQLWQQTYAGQTAWVYLNIPELLGGKCTSQPKLPLVMWSVERWIYLTSCSGRPHGLKHETRGCIFLKNGLGSWEQHHLLSLYKSFLKFPSNVFIQPSKTTSNHSSKNDPVPGSPGVVPLVRGAGKPAVFNVIVDIVIDWLYSLLLKQLDLPWLISILVRILILHTLQSFQHLFN